MFASFLCVIPLAYPPNFSCHLLSRGRSTEHMGVATAGSCLIDSSIYQRHLKADCFLQGAGWALRERFCLHQGDVDK